MMQWNGFKLKQVLIDTSVSHSAFVYPEESNPGIKALAFERQSTFP